MGTTMSDWMITPQKMGFGKSWLQFQIWLFHGISSIYFQFLGCKWYVFVGFLFRVLSSEVGNSTFATTCSRQVFAPHCGCFWSSVLCGISNVSRWTVWEAFPTWKQKRCWSYVAQHMSRRSGNEKSRVGKVCWGSLSPRISSTPSKRKDNRHTSKNKQNGMIHHDGTSCCRFYGCIYVFLIAKYSNLYHWIHSYGKKVHLEILLLKDNHADQVDAPPRWRKRFWSWLASSISKIHDCLKG